MRKAFVAGICSWAVLVSGQIQMTSTPQPDSIAKSDYQTVQQGQHFQIHQRVSFQTNQVGRVRAVTNSYTTLGTGMNHLKDGQWLKSKAEIKLNQLGAIAAEAPHKVQFAADINTEGAIDLMTPDNKRIRSHVLGLAYYDFHLRKSVLIAELKSSVGELVGDNKVIYRNAFTDFRADVEYTYRLDGLEQDVILRERPPLPQEYGFDPVTTRLLVLTEFLNPPIPKLDKKLRKGWKKDEVDRIIDFGAMKIVPGRAFGIGAPPDRFKGVPVTKYWQKLDGRDFLVEEVDFRLIVDQLSQIPERAQAKNQKIPNSIRQVVSKDLKMPLRRVAQANSTKQIQVAEVQKQEPGLVLDYAILNVDATNFTFRGDMTYYITNSFVLDGTTTIEGGTVVKFAPHSVAPESGIIIIGPVNCLTKQYSPAVFTAKDDNSVGDTISGSTGTPSGIYGNVPLFLEHDAELSHLRFLYAHAGVYSSEPLAISDSQFLHCDYAVQIDSTFTARNILMSDVDYGFFGHWFHGSIEHLTMDSASALAHDWAFQYDVNCTGNPSSTIAITNSILTAVSSLGTSPVTQDHLVNLSSASGVFQTVGAGAYYLAENSSYRDYGTTSISLDVNHTTTYPPIVISNGYITNDLNLLPQAQRDTDTPDLGYHYDPLDYVFGSIYLTNCTVSASNGVAIGTFSTGGGYGLTIGNGSKFISEGKPHRLNHIVNYNTVQEQSNTNWISDSPVSVSWGGLAPGPAPEASFRFTEWSMVDKGRHFDGYDDYMPDIYFLDCQFFSGQISESGLSLYFTNNFFHRVFLDAWVFSQADLVWQNNTFYGCSCSLADYFGNLWMLYDNLFVNTTISQGITNDFNAFYNSSTNLASTGASNVVLTNLVFETGPLGDFYLATSNTKLINAGSTNAGLLTLYHYTTATNQVKETNSIVDIGFHYVAVNSLNQPIDTDGDGIPDYLEDKNGDGIFNNGESDWKTYESNGGLGAGLGLKVFTPLK